MVYDLKMTVYEKVYEKTGTWLVCDQKKAEQRHILNFFFAVSPAISDLLNTGVRLPNKSIKPTPLHFFVDDDIYGNVFDSKQIWQAITASIKEIYILLGELDLTKWQDLVLFDKLEDMTVSFSSCILGQIVNTGQIDVKTPLEFIADI